MSHEPSEIFETIRAERGGLADIHSAFKSFPVGVAAHYDFYKRLVLAPNLPLPRRDREYLAWKTSEANSCPYCVGHHKSAFQASEETSLDSVRRAALDHLANELTKCSWKASQVKSAFFKAGYSEAQWSHAVMVVSYFNFANRCAHAMNLELEEGFEATCK